MPGMQVKAEAIRLCVDTRDDLDTVAGLIRHLKKNDMSISWQNIMAAVDVNPELLQQNSEVVQKVF